MPKFLGAFIVVWGLLVCFLIVQADTTSALLPLADGGDDSASWRNAAGTACNSVNCYIEVDDASGASCANSDGDTTYITSNTNNVSQTFDISESGIPDGSTITQISITTCSRRTQGGASFQMRYCHNGSCVNSGINIAPTAQYAQNTQSFTVDLNKTSGSDLEIGMTSTANRSFRVSRVGVVVTYTPPVAPACGDGTIDAGEQCDDGINNGQVCTPPYGGICFYCSNSCLSVQLTGPYCGDSIANGSEGCDAGANNGQACTPAYGSTCNYCSNLCQPVQLTGPYCGDGLVDVSEECDDANTNNGDGCSSTCQIETPIPTCGDSNLDSGEECDNGASNGQVCTTSYGDTCTYCSSNCQNIQLTGAHCGDGIVNGAEECDDGNIGNGDGCSSSCFIETDAPIISVGSGQETTEARKIRVAFSGQIYPGGIIDVLRRGNKDEEAVYYTVPLESHQVAVDGTFDLLLGALVNDEYFLALRAEDKDGRKTAVMAFDIDLRTEDILEVRDILFPPTIELDRSVVSHGKEVKVFGYAGPANDIIIEVGGVEDQRIKSNSSNGYWSAMISTGSLVLGQYEIKVKQINSSQKESSYSLIKKIRVSLLSLPEIDFNNDEVINIIDWSVFLSRWGGEDQKLKNTIDLNYDGKININDFSIFLNAMKL